MELSKSQTWKNLETAFANESKAHVKYQFFAKKAKKEKLNVISSIFQESAENEKEHAKIWYKAMHNDDIPVTKENLLYAISAENYETNIMYRDFAKIAKEEGFDNIADLFNLIGDVEKHHSERFQSLLKSLEENSLYESKDPVLWICTNCGHLHFGKIPPDLCPICIHPKAYFVRENKSF